MEISLKQHLASLGWDSRFLSPDGCFARANLIDFQACYEPFSRLRRLFSSKRLPVRQVIPDGTKIKFLKSLKYETAACRWWIVRLFIFFLSRFRGLKPGELKEKSIFEGYLDAPFYKPFSEFPFDEYLTVKGRTPFCGCYTQSDGTQWSISHIALTYITQIEIFVGEIPGEYQPFTRPDDAEAQRLAREWKAKGK